MYKRQGLNGVDFVKNKREIGFEYEKIAKEYLEENGLIYVTSNYYSKFGEIDLIFLEEMTETLIFVEVKYRKNDNHGNALEMVTKSKQKKIICTSNVYIFKNQWNKNIRYDIVGIDGFSKNINWVKNAF